MFGFSSLRCGDCDNLDIDDKNSYGEAYCPMKRDYVSLDDYTCRSFKPNFYVITAYSIINNVSLNGNMMTVLIRFRDLYMQNNHIGKEFLDEYKYIGPVLAQKLINDMYRIDVTKEMEESSIFPMLMFIQEERYEEAQNTFIEMIEKLKIRYGYSIKDMPKDKVKRL